VPQIFYIKSFSSFDGDFVAIVLRNAWLIAVLSVFLEDIQSVDGLLMIKYQTGRCCNDVVLFSRVNAQINSSRILNFLFNTITCIFQCKLPN
jgi:hypothetical protein